DYLKSIITGKNLPPDLARQAANSPFFGQYDNTRPLGMRNPAALPNTDMKDAFEQQQPQVALPASAYKYGFAAWLVPQDQPRVMDAITNAGFGWAKQQIRWADMEPTKGQIKWFDMDPIVATARANGVRLLFSVVTSPPWARADHRTDGPPDNYADFGNFL